MKAISFADTTPALLAGIKTCTRRDWKDSWARGFHAGQRVAALDKDRRAGGKVVAVIELTEDPYRSPELPIEDWVIVGGESGPGFRKPDPAWFLSLRDQCWNAGVPFFFKQWGGLWPGGPAILDGQEWRQMPDESR